MGEDPPALTQASARRGLLVTAVVLALMLVAASFASWRGAARATTAVAYGQADTYLRALGGRVRLHDGAPSQDDLQGLLDAFSADGLLWVGLVDDRGVVLVQAGEVSAAPLPLDPDAPRLERLADRYRVVAPRGRPMGAPPPPVGSFVPTTGPDGLPGGPPPPPGLEVRRGVPPALILEFKPSAGSDLVTGAGWTFVVSSAAALVLLGAAWVFWRVAARASQSEEELARQRHLATLGEMSAVLAHEIRNPLAALKGHAQLLLETLPDEGAARAKAGRVLGSAERLERLVEDLLSFARSGQITRTQTDPVALVRSVVDEVAPRVAVDVDQAPASWSLDKARVRQVIANLVGNALESCPVEQVRCVVSGQGDRLVIEVRDRGPGVPVELREQIFEPFHTGKTRGVGLGLAVARRICALHGGSLTVTDQPGGGAIFRAAFP